MKKTCNDIAPKKINSLQALMHLKPENGSQWGVFAYVLNADIIGPDGKIDDLRGILFSLGSYANKSSAEEHAKNIISITGHPGVTVSKYGYPVRLTVNPDPNTVENISVDTKGKIIQLEDEQYKKEKEEFEQRAKREKEILEEEQRECDVNDIEHYKRQCYLAIRNKAKYEFLKKQADEALSMYQTRLAAAKDHYTKHPEHEKDWLPYLKNKLTKTGELELYATIEKGYEMIRQEIINSPKKNISKDPISCECQGEICEGLKSCNNDICSVDNPNVPNSKLKSRKNKPSSQGIPATTPRAFENSESSDDLEELIAPKLLTSDSSEEEDFGKPTKVIPIR